MAPQRFTYLNVLPSFRIAPAFSVLLPSHTVCSEIQQNDEVVVGGYVSWVNTAHSDYLVFKMG